MNPRSIEFRLILFYTIVILLLGAALSFLAIQSFQRYAHETTRTEIAVRADAVSKMTERLVHDPHHLREVIEERFAPASQDRFIRVTIDGEVIYQSGIPENREFDPASTLTPNLDDRAIQLGKLLLYVNRFTTPDGRSAIVESGQSDRFEGGVERAFARSLLVGLPILLFFTALGGFVLIRRALKPVERMIKVAEEITFNDPHNRLPLPGTGDRIEMLVLALNRMLDRLDGAYQYASRFSSDAAHELRTPLAIIRGELDLITTNKDLPADIKASAENVLEEVIRLSELVDHLVLLSRMESLWGKRVHSLVDLSALATETIDQMQLLADERAITLKQSARRAVSVAGDQNRLKQVLVNLVDNAIKYTPEGGQITVDVQVDGDRARLTVSDSGIGIMLKDQEHIFDRFYRVSTNRGEKGAGLGLSIVRSICHAHGGSIHVTSAIGQGSKFCVELPLARSESLKALGASARTEPAEKSEGPDGVQAPNRGIGTL